MRPTGKIPTCCAFFGLAVIAASIFAGSNPVGPTGPVPGRFIVKVSGEAKPDLLRKSLSQGSQLEKASPLVLKDNLKGQSEWDRFYIFTSANKSLTASDVVAVFGEENVAYVEQDYYLEFFEFPTDSLFVHQWYLYNYGQQYFGIERIEGSENDSLVLRSGTSGSDIRLAGYYANPPAEHTAVVVAIIDSGTDLEHPELQGRFWQNPDEIPGNSVDDDHNGYIDDTLGYDISGDVLTFVNPVADNDPTDEHGHGTHIAGLIAARWNGCGIAGVAPSARIMPVKIRPNGTHSVAAAAIMYAVNSGAQIISISWGSPFESGIIREALAFARRNDVLVCVAAGNSSSTDRYYPAAHDSVFTVAAGNSDGYMAYFSTYGAHIDIVSPGLDILSLRAAGTDMYARLANEPGVRIIGEDSLYYLADGTSMSTPIVAGAAALIWSVRPSLSLSQLESILLAGATDMIDPFNQGDVLPGPDTISGHGYLNVDASLALLLDEGLSLTQPHRGMRYTDDVPIKVTPSGGYEGAWALEYSIGPGSEEWQFLASGAEIPGDSILYVFNDTTLEGCVNLRLTDKYGSSNLTSFIHVRRKVTSILSPASGERLKYDIPIYGSAYGPDFDSMAVYYSMNGPLTYLMSSSGEFFDSLLFHWTLSGLDTGACTICLFSYYASGDVADTTTVYLESAFAVGWPQRVGGRGGITPVCADLNHDGAREIVIATSNGVCVFHHDGTIVDGYPVAPGSDMRCIPAIYDIDHDGEDEIICTGSDGIHVFKYDGSYAEGWPQECYTGLIPFGYGYPNPTVAKLGAGEDSAIVIINKVGQILAYEFNGDSYFYSLEGLFTSFDPRISDSYGFGGFSSPFVTSTDLNADGLYEVVASYTSPHPHTGLGIFEGRTGRPAFGMAHPLIVNAPMIYGTALADLDGDGLLEIVTAGYDSSRAPHIWIKTHVWEDYSGWPVVLPDVEGWIGFYPILADLDLDSVPEILCPFFEFDISRLYIFNADGSAYAQLQGQPDGVAFVDDVTMGIPMVANLLGDEYPEIVFRSGYVFPGTGPERLHILDHVAQPAPGWPVTTPARTAEVFSSRFAPLIDDIDGDELVELVLVSDNADLLVLDFEAPYQDGRNRARFLTDNLNTNIIPPAKGSGGSDGDLPRLLLRQNYPNPFNPSTTISFDIPNDTRATIDVFNVLGQKVSTLLDRELAAGGYRLEFDGSPFASGLYFYRLRTKETTSARKMVLIR